MALLIPEKQGSLEENNNAMKGSISSLKADDPCQRSLTLSSQESIQLWIDSLSEGDVPDGIDEEIEVMMAKGVRREGRRPHLSVDSEDDLVLGAEAKTLGSSPCLMSLSPRISPLPPMEREDDPSVCKQDEEKRKESDIETEDMTSSVSISLPQTRSTGSPIRRPPLSRKYNSLDSSMTYDSVIESVYDLRSALGPCSVNPEEMLESLGFGVGFDSPLARIPHRFFQRRSSANGIDVDQFVDDYLDTYSECSLDDEREDFSRAVLSRFSQSSIDLSSVESDTYIFRRRLRSGGVPTILIDSEEETDVTSKVAIQKGSNSHWSKLSTLEEELEPPCLPRNPWRSPRSSVSLDRRPSLQRQRNVDFSIGPCENGTLRRGWTGNSSFESEEKAGFDHVSKLGSPQTSFEKEDRRQLKEKCRKSLLTEFVDELVREPEESNQLFRVSSLDQIVEVQDIQEMEEGCLLPPEQPLTSCADEPSALSTPSSSPYRVPGSPRSGQSTNLREISPKGNIEDKINHLKVLLKLDTPVTSPVPRKVEISLVKGEGDSQGSIQEDPLPKKGSSTLPVSNNAAGESKERAVKVWRPLSQDLPPCPTADPSEPPCKRSTALRPQAGLNDAQRGTDIDLDTFLFEDEVFMTGGAVVKPSKSGASLHSVNVEGDREAPSTEEHTLPRARCRYKTDSCNYTFSESELTDEVTRGLLEKLSSSRHRLRSSMSFQKRGAGKSRNKFSKFFSMPDMLDLASECQNNADEMGLSSSHINEDLGTATSLIELRCPDKHQQLSMEPCPDSEKECSTSTLNDSSTWNPLGKQYMTTNEVDRPSPESLLRSIRNEMEVSDISFLQNVGKKASRESDQTFVHDELSDETVRGHDASAGKSSATKGADPCLVVGRKPRVIVVTSNDNDRNGRMEGEHGQAKSIERQKAFKLLTKDTNPAHDPVDEYQVDYARRMTTQVEHHSEANETISRKDNQTASRADTPMSLVGRTKARMLPKGCSMDSSGFEDESEQGRISPDKSDRESVSPGPNKMACHLCQSSGNTGFMQVDSAMTSGSSTGVSDISLIGNKSYNPDDASTHCTYCLNEGSDDLADLNVLCLDHDHFDFLVKQLSSMKRDMQQQEERLRQYIDEQLEWKSQTVSLRHEITILKAELKIKEDENSQLKARLRETQRFQ